MRVFKCGNVHPPDQGANGGRGARAQASAAATSVAKLAAAATAAQRWWYHPHSIEKI